jgi:predicted O-methyltransferase YrrM
MNNEQKLQAVMSIYGKMSDAECKALMNCARTAVDEHMEFNNPIVELGTFTGRSAALMALACGDPSRIWTYDNYKYKSGRYKPSKPKNEARMKAHGIHGIHFVQGDTRGPLAECKDVCMLFIDSEHTRKHVLAELAVWTKLLSPTAIISFHDIGHPKFDDYSQCVLEVVDKWVSDGWVDPYIMRAETFLAVKLAGSGLPAP